MKKGTNKHSISKWKHKLLIGLITGFISISAANAASIGIPEQFKTPAQILYSNCSSPTNCTIGMSVSEYTYQNHGFYYNSSAVTLGNSGVYINFLPDVMPQSNYVYSVSTFLCFDSSNLGSGIYPNVTTYAGYNDRKFSPNNYHYTAPATVDLNSITIADWGSGEIPDKCIQYTSVIVPSEKSNWLGIHITNTSSSNGTRIYFMGYYAESLGVMGEYVADDVAAQVGTIVKNSGLATATSVDEVKSSINQMKTEIANKQQETNNKLDQQLQQDKNQHDEFMNSDLSEEDKQKPNDDGYKNYTESENELKDKMNQADLGNISIGLDANSSSWVWDTLTRLIQSHSVVFGMFIAILSIGIIKLALGR